VLYFDADGKRRNARTLERPKLQGGTTKLLVSSGARLDIIDAKYSPTREPGTWSRVVEPAS
jgi:hypothetical protein